VVVLAGEAGLFEIWLVLGSALAAPIFASTVVALPLLLDRDIGVHPAVLVSVRAALLNPAPMALWATLILLITLIGYEIYRQDATAGGRVARLIAVLSILSWVATAAGGRWIGFS
jgi:hypothetical protein